MFFDTRKEKMAKIGRVIALTWKFQILVWALLITVLIKDGFGAMFLSFLFIGMMTISFLFAAWQMAKNDILWTILGRGQIKAIDSGDGNPVAYLSNLPGHYVNSRGKVVHGDGPGKTFLQEQYGMYWIGLPPHKVHDVEFVHERPNPNVTKDTPSSQWMIRDEKPTKSKYLLWEITHTIVISDVDFSDRFQGVVKLECRSRVVDVEIALYLRRGQFLDFAKTYFEAGTLEWLRKMDWIQFSVNEPKMSGSQLMANILSSINSIVPDNNIGLGGLAASSGIEVLDAFISRWEPNEEQKKALKAQETASLEGDAAIKTAEKAVKQAEQAALRLQVEAKADLKAANTRAAGQSAMFNTLLESIKQRYPEMDPVEALRAATQLSIAQKMSDPDSPVSVLGAGINIGVDKPSRRE